MVEQIVIDTNILVNAFRKDSDAHAKAYRLIADVYRGKYLVYVSDEIVDEYIEVLHRKRLRISPFRRFMWLLWIKRNGMFIEPKPTTQDEVEMRDEDDRIFFDVAKCVGAKLVTRNYKHFPVHELVTLIDELYG